MQFVFPNAPLSVQGAFSKAWWPIDINALMLKVMSGNLKDVFTVPPPGLADSRALILKLVEELKDYNNVSTSKIVLCGFSQGSMLATDVALHLPESPAGLVVFSGVILAQEEWVAHAPARKGLKVFQSHGQQDPLLPYQLGVWLKDFFTSQAFSLEFVSFNGGHTIDTNVISKFAQFLLKL